MVKGHMEVEGRDDVGSNNKSWGGSIESTGGRKYFLAHHQWIWYFEWLQLRPEEVARCHQFEVCAYATFLNCCVLISGIRNVHSIITFIWWRPARDQGCW